MGFPASPASTGHLADLASLGLKKDKKRKRAPCPGFAPEHTPLAVYLPSTMSSECVHNLDWVKVHRIVGMTGVHAKFVFIL